MLSFFVLGALSVNQPNLSPYTHGICSHFQINTEIILRSLQDLSEFILILRGHLSSTCFPFRQPKTQAVLVIRIKKFASKLLVQSTTIRYLQIIATSPLNYRTSSVTLPLLLAFSLSPSLYVALCHSTSINRNSTLIYHRNSSKYVLNQSVRSTTIMLHRASAGLVRFGL